MKLKKILAVALSTLMIVSTVFTISASAVASCLIDTSKTGSLNVYKYEMDDTSGATFSGTGESTDANKLPATATPLAGVTFKATRVANLIDSSSNLNTTYYTTAGVSLPTVTEAKAMTAIATYTKTTDSTGYAKFDSLPLGIYLVQETSSPNQVTGKVDDFVVSIPMTKSSGTAWNYDVYVYPKNETKYTDVTIKKTDYSTGTALKGAVFTLERLSGSTWITEETGLTTNENGLVTTTNSIPVNTWYKFVETKAPDGYILDENNKTTVFYINSDGYVCEPSTKKVLDSSDPYKVNITNTKPTISKKETNSKANLWTYDLSDMSYSVGDTVYNRIFLNTPNISDMSTLNTFKVVDKLDTSLTFQSTNKIRVGSTDKDITDYASIDYDTSTNTLTYTFDTSKLTANTQYSFTIIMNYNSAVKNKLGTAINNTAQLVYSTKTNISENLHEFPVINSTSNGITITTNSDGSYTLSGTATKTYTALYGANLSLKAGTYYISGGSSSENVYFQVAVTRNGTTTYYTNKSFTIYGDETRIYLSLQTGGSTTTETNTIIYPRLIASSTSSTSTTSSNDTTNTINSNTVETHTGGFQFKKVDNNGNALAGAQFRIYTTLENAKAGTNALSVYTGTGTSLTKTVTSDSNGLVSFYGLYYGSAGTKADTDETTTYYIAEVYAPSGYNLLSEPFKVEVSNNSHSFTNTQYKVINNIKSELPLTGGYGAMMFIICGTALVITGSTLFVFTRKKRKMAKHL
jgi:fimbrial isopeptide formation D2 family protein